MTRVADAPVKRKLSPSMTFVDSGKWLAFISYAYVLEGSVVKHAVLGFGRKHAERRAAKWMQKNI